MGQNGPERGLRGRLRRRQAAHVADGIREATGELVREGAEIYRRLQPEARQLGKTAAHDGGRLVAALLLAVLGLVFALLALLAAVAFGVVGLAGVLPTWAAGLLGALCLALLAVGAGALARTQLGRLRTPRGIARQRPRGRRLDA